METEHNAENEKIHSQIIGRTLVSPIFLVLLVFVPAGRVDYWQGWYYSAINILFLVINSIVLSNKKELIAERFNPGKGIKSWDKIYFMVSTPLYFIALILGALDTGRYGWSPDLPLSVYIIAGFIFLAGHSLFLLAKWTNRFFSSVVRIQTDRNHEVCRSGPYRVVRHPGYVGALLYVLITPLLLGSLWALIPQTIAAVLLIIRTYLEDETLKKELAGYREYASQVPYRLLPGIW